MTTLAWRSVMETAMGAWPPPFVGGGFLVAYAQLVAFYYAAGALLHFAVPAMMEVKSVQVEARRSGSVGRDALYSLGPLALKAGVWTVVEWMHSNGVGQLYDGPVSSVWHALYLLLTVAALDYLHDGWFYLTHRLLHWRPLYRHVHYIHHLSKQPSAFTGYSFHIVEALIVFANEVFVCLMFPLHIRLHRAYHLATTIIHQGGHAGYEIAPFIPTAVGLASLLLHGPSAQPPAGFNTVRHHDMHHRFPSRHFSLYFTHWDRWLGTLHPEYDASVAQHFRKARGQADGYVRVGEEEADCVVKRGTVDAADGAEPVLRMHSARSANGAGSPK